MLKLTLNKEYAKKLIRNYPDFIRYVKKPNRDMQLIAVRQKPETIRHLDNPCQVVRRSVKNKPIAIVDSGDLLSKGSKTYETALKSCQKVQEKFHA